MALSGNIRALREARGWSTYDLAGKIGKNQSIVARAEAGSRPRKVTLGLIARAFGITEQQLEYGDPSLDVAVIGSVQVPILTYEEAGAYMDSLPKLPNGKKREHFSTTGDFSEQAFALRVADRSMVPAIHPGDTIIVDPEYAPEPESYVVAVDPSGALHMGAFRRLARVEGKSPFELHPINTMFPDVRSDHAKLRIIGRIRQSIRTF